VNADGLGQQTQGRTAERVVLCLRLRFGKGEGSFVL
jgi:hypothetical protein